MAKPLKKQPAPDRAGGGTKNQRSSRFLYLNNTSSGDKTQAPELVKIYPEILLAAARVQKAGAVRLWFLAKHYDQPGGFGKIPTIEFRRWVIDDLKWKPGTYDRYLNQAEHLGIIERQGNYFRLAAAKYTALAVSCRHVGDPQTIKLKRFAGDRWLPYSYAAFMRQFNGQIISARTISELTGIPIRTVYYYERLLGKGIRKQHNYALHASAKSKESIYKLLEQGRPVFDNNGETIERLPNKRFICAEVARAPKHLSDKGKIIDTAKGQKDKINSALNAVFNTLKYPEGSQKGHEKRYIESKQEEQELMTTLKKKARHGEQVSRFIYRFEYLLRGTGYYAAI